MTYDFSGWATRSNLRCSDGRTILKDAFKDDNGKKVPLVWNHQHNEPENVLGHALLEDRDGDVYAYCRFNDTESGQNAKKLVEHGDVFSLSIYANGLKQRQNQNGIDVIHGAIREVSLVLAGANPGAYIDSVIRHSDGSSYESDSEGIIYSGEPIAIAHADKAKEDETVANNEETVQDVFNTLSEKQKTAVYAIIGSLMDDEGGKTGTEEAVAHADQGGDGEETVQDVFNTLSEKQKTAVYALIGAMMDDEDDNEEDDEVKHNVFDTDEQEKNYLSHADQESILKMAKSNNCGSLRAAMEYFTEKNEAFAHGIDGIETLFPDYEDVRKGAPELLERDQGWVGMVMSKTHKSPISRIRTRQADARANDLRAFGYQKKGDEKKAPGNIKLLKRTTDPQTVYRKDQLHRDDIVDINDFDVVNYMYGVMRRNLEEELALAIMIGDNRDDGDENKIHEEHIRSIWHDDDLYTIHADVDVEAARKELNGTETGAHFGENYIYAEAIINASLYAREQYKGSGSLEFYCTPHLLNVMLLARDLNGRRIYSSKADLAAALNVTAIHTAEQFEGKVRTTADSKKKELLGLFVNLGDYSLGSTKGGEITRFNQFDIDFNMEKYLIETRVSGALTRVYSAIALEKPVADASAQG